MKKIGNKIFSAEINSASIEVFSVQLMKDVPILMQSAIYGARCRIYCKMGCWQFIFHCQVGKYPEISAPITSSDFEISENHCEHCQQKWYWSNIGKLDYFLFSHISSCDILAALPWLICNVWGTLFVSSNGRRRREYMWWEGILFIPSKNNSGIHIK